MNYLLFNPLSGEGESLVYAKEFCERSADECKVMNLTEMEDFHSFFAALLPQDTVYLFGGDGTLNRFVNAISDIEVKNEVYYYPAGTGNDFCVDVGMAESKEPFLINEYIKNLPTVTVNGKDYRFINGVGYGIDGYCCEVGDKLKSENKKPNYTSIAIKGLLFHFKPVNATVTVDNESYSFKKVWIAPTMFGRHYGGGMIPTPDQKRDDGKLSLMIFHGSGKLKTLMIFPSIFKGEHVKKTKNVTVMKGEEITVSFDRPTPLQIDGETILGVTEYKATAKALKAAVK